MVAPVPNLVAPVSDVNALIQDMPTPVAGAVAPLTQLQSLIQDMLSSGAGAVAPLTQLQSLVQDMLSSGTGAVVPVTQLQADLYSFLVGIAGVAPMSDVIALIQDMLPSVAGAVVPVTQLQSELASFLFGITGVEPVVDARGGIDSAALSGAVHAWVASELPRRWAFAGIPDMPVADIATGVAPLGGIAASSARKSRPASAAVVRLCRRVRKRTMRRPTAAVAPPTSALPRCPSMRSAIRSRRGCASA